MRQTKYELEQQPMYLEQNSYQMLKMDDMDEKEMLLEIDSTRISEVTNKKTQSIKQEKTTKSII